MSLHTLKNVVGKSKKRVGRGLGSGKGGHTVGRGQKGQKTRGKISPLFEGTKVKKSLIKRLPLLRGKGKLKSRGLPVFVVDVSSLNVLPNGSTVSVESLIHEGIAPKEAINAKVKILGNGQLSKKLTVIMRTSKGAKITIEKAGGSVVSTTQKQ